MDPSLGSTVTGSLDVTASSDMQPSSRTGKGIQSKEITAGSGSRATDGRNDRQIMKEPVSRPYEENVDEKKIDEFLVMDGKERLFRKVENLDIKPLKTYYFANDTIKFKIPDHVSHFEAGRWVKQQMSRIFHDPEARFGGRIDLKLDEQCLKFSGTFHDSFTVCYFDAQVWKIEFKPYTEKDYVLEFRRTSNGGEDAFGHLVWQVAASLMEIHAAEKFGNGNDILPSEVFASDYDKLTCWENFTKEDLQNISTDEESAEEKDWDPENITKDPDKVEEDPAEIRESLQQMGYFDGPSGGPIDCPLMTPIHEPKEPILHIDRHPFASPVLDQGKLNCMLEIEPNLVQLWTEQIEQRIYPATGEAIRTLRMCCYEKANSDETVNAVRKQRMMLQALCKELKLQFNNENRDKLKRPSFANAEVCINILEIFYQIIKDPSNDKLLLDNDILQLAAKCTFVFSGFFLVPNEHVPQVTVIMQVALEILDIFTDRHGRDIPAEKCNDAREYLVLLNNYLVEGPDADGLGKLSTKIVSKLNHLPRA